MTGVLSGRYALGELLGEGSAGVVYRVHAESGNPEQAIKVIRSPFADDPAVRRRFSEASTWLYPLRGPNLVAVEDLVIDPDMLAIVTEFASGGTLRDALVLEGKFAADEALPLIIQVLTALAGLHASGLTHGGLTTQNILLSESETGARTAKLSDYATLRLLSGPKSTPLGDRSVYTAPEVVRGQAPSPASDLYSAGIVLHEMLTGEPPALAGLEASSRPARLQLQRPAAISSAVWNMLARWLSPHPSRRATNTWGALAAVDNLLLSMKPSRPQVRRGVPVKSPAPALQPTLAKVAAPAALVFAGASGAPDVLEAKPDFLEVTTDLSVVDSGLSLPSSPPPPPFGPGLLDSGAPFNAGDEPGAAILAPPMRTPPGGWLSRWPRARWFNAAAAFVALLLICGTFYGLSGSSGPKSYFYSFNVENNPQTGLQVNRAWTLTAGKKPTLAADIQFQTTKAGTTVIDELLPKSLLADATSVSFAPKPAQVDSNHVVRFTVTGAANQVLHVSYLVHLRPKVVSDETLQNWASEQQQEAGDLYRADHQLASISVAKLITLTVGTTSALTVGGTLADGSKAPSVALDGASYRVDNTRIATVAADGRLTGKHVGKTKVHVTLGSFTVTSNVLVLAGKKAAAKKAPVITNPNTVGVNSSAPNADTVTGFPTTNPGTTTNTTTNTNTNSSPSINQAPATTPTAPVTVHTAPPVTQPTKPASGPTTPVTQPPATTPTAPATQPPTTTPTTTPTAPATQPPATTPTTAPPASTPPSGGGTTPAPVNLPPVIVAN